ncbi:MAG: PTS sugar transporter subunit IIB [Firmicutes bacterium]|nr:PTS sugar transporter subunit IIB [Bacillota bacterium]
MGFALVRVDDRLIHGQVMAVWAKGLSAERIVIVDDGVAQDPFLQKVMRLAAPPHIKVEIWGMLNAPKVLREGDHEKTILLLKRPEVALELRKKGVLFEQLNVGGIGAGPGRKPIYRNISASPTEIQVFAELTAMGVEVVFRIVPDDHGITFSELAPKLRTN